MDKAKTHAQRLYELRGGRKRADGEYDRRRRADPRLMRAARIRSSRRWRQVRAQKLRQSPLCEQHAKRGEVVVATQVDHIRGLLTRPDLAFVMSNLQSLCTSCHAAKSADERKRG